MGRDRAAAAVWMVLGGAVFIAGCEQQKAGMDVDVVLETVRSADGDQRGLHLVV